MLNLGNYKLASATEWRKCKHVFPLKFTIVDLECEAILMGPHCSNSLHTNGKMVTLNEVVRFLYLPEKEGLP